MTCGFTTDCDGNYSLFFDRCKFTRINPGTRRRLYLNVLMGTAGNFISLRKLTPLPAESSSISISMECGVIGRGRRILPPKIHHSYTCVNGPVWKIHSSEN